MHWELPLCLRARAIVEGDMRVVMLPSLLAGWIPCIIRFLVCRDIFAFKITSHLPPSRADIPISLGIRITRQLDLSKMGIVRLGPFDVWLPITIARSCFRMNPHFPYGQWVPGAQCHRSLFCDLSWNLESTPRGNSVVRIRGERRDGDVCPSPTRVYIFVFIGRIRKVDDSIE